MNQRDLRKRLAQIDPATLEAMKELLSRWDRARTAVGHFASGRAEAYLQAVALILGCEVKEVREMVVTINRDIGSSREMRGRAVARS